MIKSKSEIIKFDTNYEGSIGLVIPYYVERVEEDDTVTWHGIDTNWRFENGQWFLLQEGGWILCDVPEYEIKYQELMSKEQDKAIGYSFINSNLYEIRIGKRSVLKLKPEHAAVAVEEPEQTIYIAPEQFEIIKMFANVRKDKDLNDIYTINDCEFTVYVPLKFRP